jgi:hypothetical protein
MISLAGIGRIDQAGVDALEKYVKDGGGVFFVAGATTSVDFVNRSLYRNGSGLFPMPLSGPQELPEEHLDNTPDVQSEDHPVFANIGNRVGYISKIFIKKYFPAAKDWDPKKNPGVHVVMRLRNGAPLLVEMPFGRGRIMVLLTSLSSDWCNWYLGRESGPSFTPFVRNLVPYLSRRSAADAALQVGQPKTISFPVAAYQPKVHFAGPGGDATAATIEAAPEGNDKDKLAATFAKTSVGGFYTAKLTTRTNKPESRVFAVNVDPVEGDLKALNGADLTARLAPEVKYKFDYASSFETKLDEAQGRNLGEWLLYVLIIVLVLEQLLAWSCGYHVSAPATAPARVPLFGSAKGGLA